MWKKRRLNIKLKETYERKVKTVGIIGLGRGVGVTQLSILISNYLSACMKKKVALLEFNSHEDYKKIFRVYNKKTEEKRVFSIADVDYYSEAGKDDYMSIRQLYDYIIMDFGADLEFKRDEFVRCDSKLILTAFTSWRLEELLYILEFEEDCIKKSWQFLYVFGDEETKRKVSRLYKQSFLRIPGSDNAYALGKEIFSLLNTGKISI